MLNIEIPGYKTLSLKYLVLDVNGTLACDGKLLVGVQERTSQIHQLLEIFLITANTYGRQGAIDDILHIPSKILTPGQEAEEKARFVKELGSQQVAAIGNGANDVLMLKEAALAIAVLQQEGACTAALLASDLVVTSICDALDLFLCPGRLRATLRR